MSTTPTILELVPHDPPMCLLDRLIDVGEDFLEAEVDVRADSLFATAEGVGVWVGVEYMAQAVAGWAGNASRLRGEAVKVGFLLGTRRYTAHWPRFPLGSTLRVRVQRELMNDEGLGAFTCSIHVGDECAAEATITVYQPNDAEAYLQGGGSTA